MYKSLIFTSFVVMQNLHACRFGHAEFTHNSHTPFSGIHTPIHEVFKHIALRARDREHRAKLRPESTIFEVFELERGISQYASCKHLKCVVWRCFN